LYCSHIFVFRARSFTLFGFCLCNLLFQWSHCCLAYLSTHFSTSVAHLLLDCCSCWLSFLKRNSLLIVLSLAPFGTETKTHTEVKINYGGHSKFLSVLVCVGCLVKYWWMLHMWSHAWSLAALVWACIRLLLFVTHCLIQCVGHAMICSGVMWSTMVHRMGSLHASKKIGLMAAWSWLHSAASGVTGMQMIIKYCPDFEDSLPNKHDNLGKVDGSIDLWVVSLKELYPLGGKVTII